MQVRLDIDYKQLLDLVKQLPLHEVLQLKKDIEVGILNKRPKTALQEKLLAVPVITDEEMESYNDVRKRLKAWRTH